MTRTSALLFAAGLAFASAPAIAHHGDAGRYDETPFTITGTVIELKLTNPHSIVVFEAPDVKDKARLVRWQAEMNGGQALQRQFGWTKEMPKIGEKITLVGRRVKNGAPYMNMTENAQITLTESGKEIYKTPNFGQPPGTPANPPPAPAPAQK